MKRSLKMLLWVALGVATVQCGEPPEEEHGEELITTLRVTFDDGTNTVVAEFEDLDGDEGGNAPVITNPTLIAGTTYTATVEVLNASEDPVEDITAEIETEGAEHQFFYAVSEGLNLTTAYDDMDTGGNPIGLAFTATTGDASTGTLTVTLRHEPMKAEAGVADGDITNAGGETDIEVTFDVTIQ